MTNTIKIVRMRLFFFQAEDGIRDTSVTGVQTCALPILWNLGFFHTLHQCRGRALCQHPLEVRQPRVRSEERRVGKECRYRVSREQAKKKRRHVQEEGISAIEYK